MRKFPIGMYMARALLSRVNRNRRYNIGNLELEARPEDLSHEG